jgi:anti-anti-sigma factor
MAQAFAQEKPANKPRRALMLDLGAVKVPTAAGLGQLVALDRRVRGSGGRLVLCNVGEKAYQVFEATRLTEYLDVRRENAVGAISRSARATRNGRGI